MARPGKIPTTVVTSDTTLKSSPGKVWAITVCNSHATENASVELQDGTSTDRWAVVLPGLDTPGATIVHAVFDPPIEMQTDIRIDITSGTVAATVFWT